MGTTRVEDFLIEMMGQKKTVMKGGEGIDNKNDKNTKKYKNTKTKKNNKANKSKNKNEILVTKRMMNQKVKDVKKDLEKCMKEQERMKMKIEDEVKEERTKKKILSKLERLKRNEDLKMKQKEDKKI